MRKMLVRSFERQMEAGLIHSGHPEALAQAFWGMFFSYTVLQGLLLDSLQPEVSSEDIVENEIEYLASSTLGHRLAWDSGTGNGQVATNWASRYAIRKANLVCALFRTHQLYADNLGVGVSRHNSEQ